MKNEELNLVKMASEYGNEEKARELVESLRWPNGPVCPHCGCEKAYKLTPKANSKSPARPGLYKCSKCRKQFTVKVGTIFEDSHIPIGKWLMALHIMCSSKKGVSALQLKRMLGLTYKSAWFMAHRIRYAMTEGPMAKMLQGTVEVDETYVGGRTRGFGEGYRGNKTPVVALIQRDGKMKAKVVVRVTKENLRAAIQENVHASSIIMTDEHPSYKGIGKHFDGGHAFVCHGRKEYARGSIHTNTAESFFALLKRGVYGTFHHVSKKHLHRYSNEFAFRWNHRKVTDGERAQAALGMIEGKRLKYRDS